MFIIKCQIKADHYKIIEAESVVVSGDHIFYNRPRIDELKAITIKDYLNVFIEWGELK